MNFLDDHPQQYMQMQSHIHEDIAVIVPQTTDINNWVLEGLTEYNWQCN